MAVQLPASHFCFYPEYVSDIFQIRGRGDAFSARRIFVFSLNMFQIRPTWNAYGTPFNVGDTSNMIEGMAQSISMCNATSS